MQTLIKDPTKPKINTMGKEVSQKEIKCVSTRPSMSYIVYLFCLTGNHCSLYQRSSPFYII